MVITLIVISQAQIVVTSKLGESKPHWKLTRMTVIPLLHFDIDGVDNLLIREIPAKVFEQFRECLIRRRILTPYTVLLL